MRFKKLSGWILMVVLLTAALVLAGGGAALANKHYVDDINDLHCDGDDNCDVPLSESKVAGGELGSNDTIVLNFSESDESDLQTQSVIVDIENVTIRGAHGPSGTTVYAGKGFVDSGNTTMFEIRRGGVTLEGFRMTSYEEPEDELESAVLVTAAGVGCLQNSGKNLTFENLTVAESAYSDDKGGGGSNLINRAFHFKTCCNDYDNVTFLDVTIGELGTADPENGNFVAGIHFEANDDDFPAEDDAYDDRYAYSVKNSTFENVSIGDSTGVQGPGILFENGGDLENIVVSDSVIGEDNSGHGIEVRPAYDDDDEEYVGDIDGFKIVDSSIISNGGSGVWIGEYSEDDGNSVPIEDVDGLLIKDSELNDHSSGYGLFIFADSVSNLEFNNAEAYNNDEDGVFVNTVGDIIDVRILNESLFEGNGGHGVLLFPADDTSSSLLSSSDSEWGLEVRDSSFVNNEDCGLLVEATKHIRDVKVEGSMDNEDTAYKNGCAGIALDAEEDLDHVAVEEYTASGNGRDYEDEDLPAAGLYLDGGLVHDLHVENSTIENGGAEGIEIYQREETPEEHNPQGLTGLTLKDNSVTNNNFHGILITSEGRIGGPEEGQEVLIENTDVTETDGGPGLKIRALSSERNLENVTVQGGTYSDNDDQGVLLMADASKIVDTALLNNTANGNQQGIHVNGPAESLSINQNRAIANDEQGIYFEAVDSQCVRAEITENEARRGEIGIEVDVGDTCGSEKDPAITISRNVLKGDSSGAGIVFDSDYTEVKENDVRQWSVGVEPNEHKGNEITRNNLVDNVDYGIEAGSDLGDNVNAVENWWGAADGPSSPPGQTIRDPAENVKASGDGDNVSEYVLFDPWRAEAVDIPTAADWEIVDPEIPETPEAEEDVEITLKVKNNTGSSGDTDVNLTVEGSVEDTETVELDAGETSDTITFEFSFPSDDSYEVTLETDDDEHSETVTVGGETVEADWNNSGIPPITGDTAELELQDDNGNSLTAANLTIAFYNLRGKKVTTKDSSEFSTTDLSDGLYVYVVTLGDDTRSPAMKVVVKKRGD